VELVDGRDRRGVTTVPGVEVREFANEKTEVCVQTIFSSPAKRVTVLVAGPMRVPHGRVIYRDDVSRRNQTGRNGTNAVGPPTVSGSRRNSNTHGAWRRFIGE